MPTATSLTGQSFYRAVSQSITKDGDCPHCRTFSFSSETPVRRYFGNEILSHEPNAIDLSRLNDGAPLLWNHDMNQPLGVVEKASIRGKKAYATVHFDENDETAMKRLDQCDRGILRNVSCRYEILDFKEDFGGGDFLVTRWIPSEISIVTVPADASVGFGRASEAYQDTVSPDTKARTMDDDNKTPTPIETAQYAKQERDRIASIRVLEKTYGKQLGAKATELAEKCIEAGLRIEDVRSQFADQILNQDIPPLSSAGPQDLTLDLSPQDRKRYSVLNAIRYAAGMAKNDEVGFELECSRAIAQRNNRPARGIYIPASDLTVNHTRSLDFMAQHGSLDEQFRAYQQQRALNVTTTNQGGTLVNTDLDESMFFEFLFNRPMVKQLGATLLTGLSDNVDIPTEDGTNVGINWGGEGDPAVEFTPTFGRVQLRPKDASAFMAATRRMMQQSSIGVEDYMRSRLQIAMALGIDRACINGTGVGNNPRGILNTAGINSVALGTNGAVPNWDSIVRLKTLINAANADIGSMAFLTSSLGFGKLETTLKNNVAGADYILNNSNDGFGQMAGFRAARSNQMPDNLTKGTGTNLAALIFGIWSQIFIGQWGGLDLTANPYGDADFLRGAFKIRIFLTIDTLIGYPKCWSAITDMITT